MEKHFRLTDEPMNYEGVTLHRIVATKPLEHIEVVEGGPRRLCGVGI